MTSELQDGDELELALFPGRDLELNLVDEDGIAITRGTVTLADDRGEPVLTRRNWMTLKDRCGIGPDGTVHLSCLPAALVVVTYHPPGVESPSSRRFDLTCPEAQAVSWIVAAPDRAQPQVEVRIELVGPGLDPFVGDCQLKIQNGVRTTHSWAVRARDGDCRLLTSRGARALKLAPDGLPLTWFDGDPAGDDWTLRELASFDGRTPTFTLELAPGMYELTAASGERHETVSFVVRPSEPVKVRVPLGARGR